MGRPGNTYDVEIGFIPTLDFKDLCIPFSLTAPTWITVGPASFWNGGTLALKNKKGNIGVFSTGLNIKFPLNSIPSRLGNWYFDIGLQYYCLINDNLLQAQTITLGLPSYRHANRNIGVAAAAIGFSF